MKIFISYHRQSEPIVRNLASDIEELGYTVWFDHELSGGQAWWDQILGTIRDCSVFIFVLTPEGLISTACKREYTYAADLGKAVLPVLVSDEVSISLLPPALSKIEFVDYRTQDVKTALRLSRALNNVPVAGPLPDPLPTPPDVPISYLGGLTEKVDSMATVSYEEQTVLLVELKRSLRDSESRDDARTLLQRLRTRRDLFATIAADIDELIESELKPVPNKVQPDARPVVQDPPVGTKVGLSNSSTSKRDGSLSIFDNNTGRKVTVPETRDSEQTTKDRLKGAAIGAVAGLVCNLLFLFVPSFNPALLIIFPLAGAIAGTICGTDRKWMFVGMIVAIPVDIVAGLAYRSFHKDVGNLVAIIASLLTLLAPTLGAIVDKRNSEKRD